VAIASIIWGSPTRTVSQFKTKSAQTCLAGGKYDIDDEGEGTDEDEIEEETGDELTGDTD